MSVNIHSRRYFALSHIVPFDNTHFVAVFKEVSLEKPMASLWFTPCYVPQQNASVEPTLFHEKAQSKDVHFILSRWAPPPPKETQVIRPLAIHAKYSSFINKEHPPLLYRNCYLAKGPILSPKQTTNLFLHFKGLMNTKKKFHACALEHLDNLPLDGFSCHL